MAKKKKKSSNKTTWKEVLVQGLTSLIATIIGSIIAELIIRAI